MYVEPEGYFTPSMRKILEEGENKKSILFEHLSRQCMDFSNRGYTGFTVYDDGSYYRTSYKTKENNENLFSNTDHKKLNEKNYKRTLIFTSKKLATTINKFLSAHYEEIKNLPESVSNPFVLDGDEDIVRLSDKIISGGNIFYSVPYKSGDITSKGPYSLQEENDKALELITTLYAEIRNIVDNERGK